MGSAVLADLTRGKKVFIGELVEEQRKLCKPMITLCSPIQEERICLKHSRHSVQKDGVAETNRVRSTRMTRLYSIVPVVLILIFWPMYLTYVC